MSRIPQKIIIDCDPGIDDALAIILAVESPGIELLGLTTVFGNADVETTTRNALRVSELIGGEVPVAMGAAKPLVVPSREHPDFVHGKDGLGNTDQPEASLQPLGMSAAEFIVEKVKEMPGEITLMGIGPLTNLADALALDPTIAGDVKAVVVMGGVLYRPGNVTPVAEANMYSDPHAADQVMTAAWDVTMVGLDVTLEVFMDRSFLGEIREGNPRYGPFLFDTHQFYIDFYSSREMDREGCPVHDSSALMYIIDPGLFKSTAGPLRVVSEGIAMGQTILAAYEYQYELEPWAGETRVTVPLEVDCGRFLERVRSILLP